MPSAAAKPALDTPVMASECTDPIRQIQKTVEHKIRNLDKRKVGNPKCRNFFVVPGTNFEVEVFFANIL